MEARISLNNWPNTAEDMNTTHLAITVFDISDLNLLQFGLFVKPAFLTFFSNYLNDAFEILNNTKKINKKY